MKRFLLLLMAAVLLLSGCEAGESVEQTESPLGAYGNTGQEEKTVIPARHYISLIFYEDMDINPLTTTNSENHELLKLVYSPLVRLNEALQPEYVLAESVTVEGTKATLVLKEGLKFSDGTAVTASDVTASLKTIRNTPTSPYYNRLEKVKSYAAADDRTVTFTLREPDVDFVSYLDLPVMKKGGDAGCGPYQFSQLGGERVLTPNPHYFVQPSIGVIYLKKPANEQERQNMFSVGLLDVYFATAESELSFSGGKNFRVQTYAGDNLLYLGVNCREGLLADSGIRGFLSGLIGREKLVQSVLLDQAEASSYPFQPGWYKAAGLVQEKNWTDPEKKQKAAGLGLNLTENMLLDSSGNQVTFSLLVAEGSDVHKAAAQAVADSFALSGVKINLEILPRADYNTRLQTGQYQLYLGEVRTGRSLNTALYGGGSAINYSGITLPELEDAAARYQQGSLTLSEYGGIFDQYTPIMPLAYRRGVLFAAADIGDFQSTGTWALYGDITKLITKETELST
ncbi:MAG: ABC transporter substrate-binding protein [Clostridia bacterium]|nr:ABC transporter substrate-binding protein [Clostridia bacterium]